MQANNEHDHNFHQLFRELAGQQVLKGICHFAVIPQRVRVRERSLRGATRLKFNPLASKCSRTLL
jgi:hypothetical protein